MLLSRPPSFPVISSPLPSRFRRFNSNSAALISGQRNRSRRASRLSPSTAPTLKLGLRQRTAVHVLPYGVLHHSKGSDGEIVLCALRHTSSVTDSIRARNPGEIQIDPLPTCALA